MPPSHKTLQNRYAFYDDKCSTHQISVSHDTKLSEYAHDLCCVQLPFINTFKSSRGGLYAEVYSAISERGLTKAHETMKRSHIKFQAAIRGVKVYAHNDAVTQFVYKMYKNNENTTIGLNYI